MSDFLMPHLGADMTAGTLLAWRKKPGDPVMKGDIIADVETDKADIEIEVFISGVLEKILITPGTRVPVGTALAVIRQEGETISEKPPETAKVVAMPAPSPQPLPRPAAISPQAGRQHVSPLARKLADELHVDLASVTPSGPGGRVTREDVEHAAQARAVGVPVATAAATALAAPVPVPSAQPDRHARMRQTIAAAMARSKREIPHYYLSAAIDLKPAMDWLSAENLKRPMEDRLLYGILLIKAVALALREVPELNAVWNGTQLEVKPEIHVGVAISLRQGGLIAPALHHADRKTLSELMRDFRDLVQRTRAGSLRSSELSDSTITITSLGEQGVESVFGIIYPPQVALVGFGSVVERPWSVAGQVVSRPVVTATLSGDHRVSDGHRGALFLRAVDRLLQTPEKL
ncbi:MAG: 2-oxo acid dehydrogenase subunit E2 [Acidobacteriia bacterium]|nr:2-oxo acid dehydrogenase subunit E2 [Terriglobia bacterium]